MDNTEWLRSYNKLNTSFKKTLVYRWGADSGFFSEYNNLVIAILYCLKNNIRFVLSSRDALYTIDKGWQDFFLPFCEENNEPFNTKFNQRSYKFSQDLSYLTFPNKYAKIKEHVYRFISSAAAGYYRNVKKIDFLTQDLWDKIRDDKIVSERFNFPELNIYNFNFLQATQEVINNIWYYSKQSEQIVNEFKNKVQIEKPYLGMHIRAGDKIIETELRQGNEYIEAAERQSDIRCAFILTDNYKIFSQLKEYYPNWKFYTLCEPSETGYFHNKFNAQTKKDKYTQHLKLLASIDLCANSNHFVGTYSSNPGMYMGMRKGSEFCTCIDHPNWKMF